MQLIKQAQNGLPSLKLANKITKLTILSLVVSIILLSAQPVLAATVDTARLKPKDSLFYEPHWTFSAALSSFRFKPEQASREAVKDRALGLSLSGHYWWQYVFISIGMDYLSYSDQAKFSQTVEDSFGDIDRESSEADAINLYSAVGPYWAFGKERNSIIYGQIGYSFSINSERSIAYCDDCYSENIDLDPGIMTQFGFLQKLKSFHLGFAYTAYPNSDDYSKNLSLILHFGF